MKVNLRIEKVIIFLLVLSMVLQYIPMAGFAADEDDLCEHHSEHTTECTYVEGVNGCAYHCDVCLGLDQDDKPEIVCDCKTDDAYHATSCPMYAAPENPQCQCAEKCMEDNGWCDVCGFDYTACTGEDTGVGYAASGTCGENLTWTLDESGTLTISGTGDMEDVTFSTNVPWYEYKAQIKKVVIQSGVTSIGNYAFGGCSSLEFIAIPNSVTRIGMAAFSSCSSLNNVVIPNGVTKIEDSLFAGCINLTNVTIPESVTIIRQNAFNGCGFTTITIPNGVTTIDWVAFAACPNLTSIAIPASVTTINGYAFRHCDNLSSVMLSADLIHIGEEVFLSCSNLENVIISDGVTTIGSLFAYCSGLKSVTIPASVTTIESSAFRGCDSLEDVYYGGSAAQWEGLGGGKPVATYIHYSVTGSVNHWKEEAKDATFEENGYTRDVCSCGYIRNEVEFDALGHDWTEWNIVKEATCTEEGSKTRSCKRDGCGYSQTETIKAVGHKFDSKNVCGRCGVIRGNCDENLTWELDLETGLLHISGIGQMTSYPWEDYKSQITSVLIDSGVTSIVEYAFSECKNLSSITIPKGITKIGGSAFINCSSLTNVILPEGLTYIGSHAFRYCTSLSSVTIPDSVSTMERSVFFGCTSLRSVALPKGITCIETEMFCNCSNLVSVSIPESVRSIGISAFNSCVNLENITIPDNVTSIDVAAFSACSKLTSITIPSGITKISDSAFSGCRGVTSIIIPDGITDIGEYAFTNCSNLENISIPNSVINIGSKAFQNCVCLKTVVIPDGVKAINENAFNNCQNLSVIKFSGNAPTIQNNAFGKVTATAFYPANNSTWISNVLQNYGGKITWTAGIPCDNGHSYEPVVTAPTCTKVGFTTYTCSCGDSYVADTVAMLGHEMDDWVPSNETEREERSDCSRCDYFEIRPIQQQSHILKLEGKDLLSQSEVYINGLAYPVKGNGDNRYVEVPADLEGTMVTYTYHVGDANDVHTQYPTGMKVYKVSDGVITYIPELDNLLQYSGSSIRITGTKGIRMITSITKSNKAALTGTGLVGYKLVEYGTALCWAKDLEGGNPMVLGKSYVKSNYAYKKGIADPVFAYSGNLVQYTNVLVGFTLNQCKDDIAMRPYIILEDAAGDQITVYGGIVYRSIGYIAYQNRNVFQPKTASYDYVWEIIHHVYGKKYDAEYKG